MAEVRLDRVSKIYENGNVAVREASFDVRDGELLVLVGPSGCGKSTLLRMIAGLESISQGTLTIDGRVVNAVPPKDRDIAMVFQSYALYPHMSVAENLAFGLKLRRLPREDVKRRIESVAAKLGLSAVLQSRPGMLSGGQRQRVALGRAIVRNPKVFLLDEPLSNLDAKLRLSTRMEIARLQRELAATMIYVTHDQIEAMTLGQRIVVLNGGVIQQIDTPMQLYARPVNMFVAGFFGSPAMNFFHGVYNGNGSLKVDEHLKLDIRGVMRNNAEIAGYHGCEIAVGVRPEDLFITPPDAATDGHARLTARVEYVEPVGNEAFVNVRYGTRDLVVRTPPLALPQPGTDIGLQFLPEKLHCFALPSGARIGA
jgi:multiple sugar transport system ATP-binding protein